MPEEKVSLAAHMHVGDLHGEVDVLDGLELLDLECCLPLWSLNCSAVLSNTSCTAGPITNKADVS